MTESRSYEVRDFDSVQASMGVRTIVTVGGDYSVRVDARDAAILDRVEVSVSGSRLHLGLNRNFLDLVINGGLVELLRHAGDLGIVAYVTLPVLNGAEASSGARLEASNLKSERLRADASSGGHVTLMAISGGELRAQASSGGVIELDGVGLELDSSVSSGGVIRADRLESLRGRIEASSGGHVEASVTARLRANASSGGHIRISGNPAERDVHSSSGGHVSL